MPPLCGVSGGRRGPEVLGTIVASLERAFVALFRHEGVHVLDRVQKLFLEFLHDGPR
jgi:hypothetical protein